MEETEMGKIVVIPQTTVVSDLTVPKGRKVNILKYTSPPKLMIYFTSTRTNRVQ